MDTISDGLYAKMETTCGDMLIRLYPEKTPLTVANFVGLAEGVIENKVKPIGTPYYDGLIFHRIIKDFMIQGGDPEGSGRGGPGYSFGDEFDGELRHDKKGVLSMANSGPDTNGSQFFITEVATPWLDDKHTVFGEVIEGVGVIDVLSDVEKGSGDKPVSDVGIKTLTILRKGKEYKKYDAAAEFRKTKDNFEKEKEEKLAVAKAKLDKQTKELEKEYTKTESGLFYKVVKKSDGKKVEKDSEVSIDYTGLLFDGKKQFDTSKGRSPLDVSLGQKRIIPGLEEGLSYLSVGDSAVFVIPPHLAYGENGAGGVIPPNAILIFEVDVLSVK